MQPFIFAANDFQNGPARSTYGATRVFDIPNSTGKLHVRVNRVDVALNAPGYAENIPFSFKDLTLEIQIEESPVVPH